MGVLVIEEWRSIPGYEGFYSASSMGSIRREPGIINGPHGPRKWAGHVMKLAPNSQGYLAVSLMTGGAKTRKFVQVHRLVAAAFLGVCPDAMQVNHKNSSKTDNRACNLEYVSDEQHHEITHRDGLHPWGDAMPQARLTKEQAAMVLKSSLRDFELASRLAVSPTTINDIRHRRTWKRLDVAACS